MTGTVIVGASVGGVRTAQSLRAAGYEGDIVLVDEQDRAPYDKPPLSKQILTGEWSFDRIALLSPSMCEELRIDLRLGDRAVAVDPAAQVVELASGDRVGYETLVVATGAHARPSPWQVADRVFVLRTVDDAEAIAAAFRAGGKVVVVGGGFIGSEVATAAHRCGAAVTVVDPFEAPLSRAVGSALGGWLAQRAVDYGVSVQFGHGVEEIVSESGGVTVVLTSGTRLSADYAVVGIGAVPNDAWLTTSGLSLDGGVLCDEFGRAVGSDSVYAVGDVACWFDPDSGGYRRVEHWTNTVDQAACVGHNIVNPETPKAHRASGYVWSDQYGVTVQTVGRTTGNLREDWIGDFTTHGRFAVIFSDTDGTLRGAATVDWPRALLRCRRALAGETPAADLVEQLLSDIPHGAVK